MQHEISLSGLPRRVKAAKYVNTYMCDVHVEPFKIWENIFDSFALILTNVENIFRRCQLVIVTRCINARFYRGVIFIFRDFRVGSLRLR